MSKTAREALEAAGVAIIPAEFRRVRALAQPEPRVEILGGIENLVAAIGALCVKVVFAEDYKLTNDDFLEDTYRDEDDDPDDSEIDLRTIDPQLDAFTVDINSVVACDFFFFHDSRQVVYREESVRYKEFLSLHGSATTLAHEHAEKAAEHRGKARVAQEQKLLRAVRALKTNPAFVQKAKTKAIAVRALVAYVRETVEGAADVDNALLTREITAIRDSLMLS
ncbi:MAG TPA: hypothetical protein VGD50_03615 [Candidatus Baltobacteraceae bacterium]